jgi:hypothetical protein
MPPRAGARRCADLGNWEYGNELLTAQNTSPQVMSLRLY